MNQFYARWPAGQSDVQRTYNGHIGTGEGDFVGAFKPAASFLYGAACAASGLMNTQPWQGEVRRTLYHGLKRIKPSSPFRNLDKLEGKYFNDPKNVPDIENGWNTYTNGVSASDGGSNKAKRYKDKGTPLNKSAPLSGSPGGLRPAGRPPAGPVPAGSNRPVSYPGLPGIHKFSLAPSTPAHLACTDRQSTRNLPAERPRSDFPSLLDPAFRYPYRNVLARHGKPECSRPY